MIKNERKTEVGESEMLQDNEKLKSELFAVISMMEEQLKKVKQKRKQRLATERQANL